MAENTIAGSAPAPHGPGQPKPFPPLDPATFAPQLIWLVVIFGLLYVLLKRFALSRVRAAIEDRRDRIQHDLEESEKLRAETERALGNYEQALVMARTKAKTVAKTLRDELTAEVAEQLAKSEAEIAQRLADAESRITKAKLRAQASVHGIAAEIAEAIVTKLIEGKLSKEEVHNALVKRVAE